MRTLGNALSRTIVILAVSVIGFLIIMWSMSEVREVRKFESQFQQVAIGDREQKVLELLGKPNAIEKKFRLGQQTGFENAYIRAAASDSDHYLVYLRGIDVVFSIGVNKEGKVSVTEYGGT